MTTEDPEHSMARVGKAAAGFEGTDAGFGGSSVGEMPSVASQTVKRQFGERKGQGCGWYFSNKVSFNSSMCMVF